MRLLCFICALFVAWPTFAHRNGHEKGYTTTYCINGKAVEGYFLMMRHDSVFIKLTSGQVMAVFLQDFSVDGQQNLSRKIALLKQLNREKNTLVTAELPNESLNLFSVLTLAGLYVSLVLLVRKSQNGSFVLLGFMTVAGIFYACQNSSSVVTPITTSSSKTDPAFIESTFTPFKSLVKTRYDDTYFYVESEGMPTHNMMVGITSWQQQVPIPQGYTGSNAWSIPLKPEFAASPLSLKSNFMMGAVAIAPNGVPIFNPLNNRGEDAFAIGELDQWGGHCGRADDYHYHIAPLHFEATAGNNPIAMALDGYAIYGSREPDGTVMQALDEYHGHTYKQGAYHYHATTTYPYFMAAIRGKVMLDPTTMAPENQLIPQAKSSPVRPAANPLKGATITDFKPTGTNAYSLEYTLNNQKGYVNYNWDNAGNFTYTFIGTDGKATTAKYVRK